MLQLEYGVWVGAWSTYSNVNNHWARTPYQGRSVLIFVIKSCNWEVCRLVDKLSKTSSVCVWSNGLKWQHWCTHCMFLCDVRVCIGLFGKNVSCEQIYSNNTDVYAYSMKCIFELRSNFITITQCVLSRSFWIKARNLIAYCKVDYFPGTL